MSLYMPSLLAASATSAGALAPPLSSVSLPRRVPLQDPKRAQDAGGIIHFEHLNLEVEDLELARLFYGEALGLTPDPGATFAQRGGPHVVWYNVGRQQFHIVRGPASQLMPGVVGISCPNMEAVQTSCSVIADSGLLDGTDFGMADGENGTLNVRDPWGNVFVVHPGRTAGISSVCLPCAPDTVAGIAEFYRGCLGANVTEGSGVDGRAAADVSLGPHSALLLREDAACASVGGAGGGPVDAYTGWHMALYVSDFSSAYEQISERQLIYNDHPYADKCHSLADALKNCQLRFQDVVLDDGSTPVARLQHEVRSLHHPQFLKALYTRGSCAFDFPGFPSGHTAQ